MNIYIHIYLTSRSHMCDWTNGADLSEDDTFGDMTPANERHDSFTCVIQLMCACCRASSEGHTNATRIEDTSMWKERAWYLADLYV